MELPTGGMTCASCGAPIEKKLNRLDGATAPVNFAAERAAVSFPATVAADRQPRHSDAAGTAPQPQQPDAREQLEHEREQLERKAA